jgi:hypothetical protein
MIKRTKEVLLNIGKDYRKRINHKRTNTVFVTLRYQKAADLILNLNKNTFGSKFKNFIKSINQSQRL